MALSICIRVPSVLIQGTGAEQTLVPILSCRNFLQDLRPLEKLVGLRDLHSASVFGKDITLFVWFFVILMHQIPRCLKLCIGSTSKEHRSGCFQGLFFSIGCLFSSQSSMLHSLVYSALAGIALLPETGLQGRIHAEHCVVSFALNRQNLMLKKVK